MNNDGHEIHVLLHNIRSSHNVGSIFRTGDAIGVSKIYLTGFTPRPLDRFGRPVKEIAKTALGAEKVIPWLYSEDFSEIVLKSKRDNFTVIGIEQDSSAMDYKRYSTPQRCLIVLGSEVDGMTEQLRVLCDDFVEIPMRGEKESLNVSVAFGVAMFRLFDK